MSIQTIDRIFVEELQTLHGAESQIAAALPSMIARAEDHLLRESLELVLRQARTHLEKLGRLFDHYEIDLQSHASREIERLIDDAESGPFGRTRNGFRDHSLLRAAQRMVQYQIAAYRCVRTLAEQCGDQAAAELLGRIYDDEDAAGRRLDELDAERAYYEALVG